MTTRTNKTSRQVQLQKVLAGLGKRYAAGTIIPLASVSYTPADLEKLVQSDLDGIAATAQAKAAYLAQVELERTTRAKVSPTLRRLKNYVLTTVGDTQDASAVLEDFGYSPRKTRIPSTASKAESVAKAKATREANKPAPKPATPPAAQVIAKP